MVKNVAICYWGMTRSTRFVYQSHHKNLFDVLKNNGIDIDVFIHSWETSQNIIWGVPFDIPIDYEEYKLLNPTKYRRDVQDDFLKSITFSDYFYEDLYKIYGGDTDYEWRPELIRNHLCALESQKRVTNMCLESEKKYDIVIYIRPDLEIYTPFSADWLNSIDSDNIGLTNDRHFDGYNDKFAIVSYDKCKYYGCRIDEIIEFRKNNGRIVSEKYTKYIISKYFKNVHFFVFTMMIVRPR